VTYLKSLRQVQWLGWKLFFASRKLVRLLVSTSLIDKKPTTQISPKDFGQNIGRGVWSVTKNQCSLWETLPCDWEVRGHCVCKEMPVIPVSKVVDPKKN
jgi:hypothetical protein